MTRGWPIASRYLLLFVSCASTLFVPWHVAAQPSIDTGLRGATGIGWTMVVPDALAGGGAFHVRETWGAFLDGSVTLGSKKDEPYFLEGRKIADMEAELPFHRRNRIKSYDEWLFLNGRILRVLSRDFALMVGGGMVRRTIIREYFDETDEAPSPSGFYFVKDERDSGWFANASAGVLFRAGRNLAWSVGFESAARSFSIGVFLMFR